MARGKSGPSPCCWQEQLYLRTSCYRGQKAGHFTDFDLEVEVTEPLPLEYLGQTVAQLTVQMEDLSSQMTGMEDRQNRLSGNLQHIGTMADQGPEMVLHLADVQNFFFFYIWGTATSSHGKQFAAAEEVGS